MNASTIKGLLIGVIIGAVAALGLTLGTGAAVLGNTAQEATDKAVENALIENWAEICVAEFNDQANFEDALRRLGDTPYHARPEFIQNGGYSRIPGQERPHPLTADSCARMLTDQHELSRG